MRSENNGRIYTLKELSSILHVTEYEIVECILEGKIKNYKIQSIKQLTPIEEKDHIIRLLPVLNKYAENIINDLLKTNRFKSKYEQEKWIAYKKSDRAFEALLTYYGDNIDEVRIVIPHDELTVCKNVILKNKPIKSNSNHLVVEVMKKVANELYNKNGNWPQYKMVLAGLRDEACKDAATGALIKQADEDGILLSNKHRICTKTVRNWLTDYKKEFPELKK